MNINRKQWYQLRDALLCAKYNSEHPEEMYESLPVELKQHQIGMLLKAYLSGENIGDLSKAAKLLAPETENYWVAIEKS